MQCIQDENHNKEPPRSSMVFALPSSEFTYRYYSDFRPTKFGATRFLNVAHDDKKKFDLQATINN
jgi:hypothetical protein